MMAAPYNYWRETQREPRFFFVDFRITVFVLLAILHFRIWTVTLLVIMTLLFIWLESRGIRPARLHRHVLTYLRGDYIHACHPSELRQYHDPSER